jgi:hypothetical protein
VDNACAGHGKQSWTARPVRSFPFVEIIVENFVGKIFDRRVCDEVYDEGLDKRVIEKCPNFRLIAWGNEWRDLLRGCSPDQLSELAVVGFVAGFALGFEEIQFRRPGVQFVATGAFHDVTAPAFAVFLQEFFGG